MSDSFNPVNGKPEGSSPARQRRAQDADYTMQLPPADELAKYEEISPGISDRILSVIERERELDGLKISLLRRRAIMTTAVSLAFVAVAGVGIWLEVFWPVVLVLGLGGIVPFILREISRR